MSPHRLSVWIESLRALGRRFLAAHCGGVAMITALSLPPLLLVSLGAIQIQAVFTDRNQSQDVADAAALWGAQQLTVTPVGAEQRTKSFAESQLTPMQQTATVTVVATKIGDTTMKVTVDTHRPSFFFNLMPAGGFYTHAEAVAEGVSQTPLCVMTFGNATSDKLELNNTSRMTAPQCLVHANEQIVVSGSAILTANTIETGASAIGPMNPGASVGAPDMSDPFATLDITGGGVLSCPLGLLGDIVFASSGTLPAGAHCGDVIVHNGQTLTLAPGEHFFARSLELKNGAILLGDNVVLIFGANGFPNFKYGASIRLAGRQTGSLAGFVIVASRDRTNELKIEADHVEKLTGTVYVPNATLNIDGAGQAAQASDWTVMAAQALKLSNAPQVQINANYYGSDVPVPTGVGNRSKSQYTNLTQ